MLKMTMPDDESAPLRLKVLCDEMCEASNGIIAVHFIYAQIHSKSTLCDSVSTVGNGSPPDDGSLTSQLSTVSGVPFFLSKSSCSFTHSHPKCKFISFPLCVPVLASLYAKYTAEPSNNNNNSCRCTFIPQFNIQRKQSLDRSLASLHNTFLVLNIYLQCVPMACANNSSTNFQEYAQEQSAQQSVTLKSLYLGKQ